MAADALRTMDEDSVLTEDPTQQKAVKPNSKYHAAVHALDACCASLIHLC